MNQESTGMTATEEEKRSTGSIFSSEQSFEQKSEEWADGYQAVSKAAVASVAFAILGLAGSLVLAEFLTLFVFGIVFALIGMSNIKRYPSELCGGKVAKAGLALCTVSLVGLSSWFLFIYYTEVPEGYQRLPFYQLAFNQQAQHLPNEIQELDGKRVFVKGYVHPGVDGYGKVRNFVLVKDMGICCFGGQPKIFDMIEVDVKIDDGVKYSRQLRKLGGTFRISPNQRKIGDVTTGIYKLEVDLIQK